MSKWIKLAAILTACSLLGSCAAASQATRDVLDKLVSDGAMTTVTRDAIMSSMSSGWQVLADYAINIVGGAILAYTGITIRRGAPAVGSEREARNAARKASKSV